MISSCDWCYKAFFTVIVTVDSYNKCGTQGSLEKGFFLIHCVEKISNKTLLKTVSNIKQFVALRTHVHAYT